MRRALARLRSSLADLVRRARPTQMAYAAARARALSPVTPAEPLAYRAYFAIVERLAPSGDYAAPLPGTLVVEAGRYSWEGRSYDLDRPGVYRFWKHDGRPAQRIVVGNGRELMSAVAWIVTHGSADDGLSDTELADAAATRKVSTTCGVTARFAEWLASAHGFPVRRVSVTSTEPRNGYDDDHVLVELREDGAWAAHDLDQGVAFERGGRPLSLAEAIGHAQTGDYDLVPLAADAAFDGTADFAFFNEFYGASTDALKEWYRHILGVQKPIDA